MKFLKAFMEMDLVPDEIQSADADSSLDQEAEDNTGLYADLDDEDYNDGLDEEAELAPEGMAAAPNGDDTDDGFGFDDNSNDKTGNNNGVIDSDYYDDEIDPNTDLYSDEEEKDANINDDPEPYETVGESFFDDLF